MRKLLLSHSMLFLAISARAQTPISDRILNAQTGTTYTIQATDTTNHKGDQISYGPNPHFDIRAFGAVPSVYNPPTTTASCNGTTSVTLASGLDFANGQGIVLHQCGPATALTTPVVTSATISPKGILNGATTRSYKIVAEDINLGMTAASAAVNISTSPATLGDNAINVSNCTFLNGIVTVTTATNHNFEVGAQVKLAGGTCFDGVGFVQTTPTATTFTIQTAFTSRPVDAAYTGAVGTAEVPGHIWLKWTPQANVMRYWIYRQDGGVGNYNLIGVAQGMEPFYDDYGFFAPETTHMPEVPLTAPVSATNDALATTIVSGAGTTNIVVANAASNTIAGQVALHDNTQAFIAAATAAYNAHGGIVYVPNVGPGNLYYVLNFPLQLPYIRASNGVISLQMNGSLYVFQPIISGGNFKGLGGGNNCGTPSFGNFVYSCIQGASYPLVLCQGCSGLTFENMYLTNAGAQSTTLLVDTGTTIGSGGATNVNLFNSYVLALHQAANAVSYRGIGFGAIIHNNTFGSTSGQPSYWYEPAVFRVQASSVSGPPGSYGIAEMLNSTFQGCGSACVTWDGDPVLGAVTQLGGPWTIDGVFTESNCGPIMSMRNINSFGSSWSIGNFTIADSLCGSTDTINFVSPNNAAGSIKTLKLYRGNGGGTSISAFNIGATAGATLYETLNSGEALNPDPGYGWLSPFTGDYGPQGGGGRTAHFYETTGGVRLVPPAQVFISGSPPSNIIVRVTAGGSVPVGKHKYGIAVTYWNGGRTYPQPAATTCVTTTGNQTCNLNWTAPSTPPLNYYIYRDGTAMAIVNAPATSYSDTDASCAICSSPQQVSGTGPIGMNQAQLWSPQYAVTNGAFGSTIQDSPLTVNRTVWLPDISGTAALNSFITYDNFNRPDGFLTSPWTQIFTSSGQAMRVSRNQVGALYNSMTAGAAYTGAAFPTDQFAEITVTNPTINEAGVTTRFSGGTAFGYGCLETATALNLIKFNNPTRALLLTSAITAASGDILRMESIGSTQNCWRNGVLVLTTTDATYSSGSPGVVANDNSAKMDNFNSGGIPPYALLNAEQDWTQNQHFLDAVTVGTSRAGITGPLTNGTIYATAGLNAGSPPPSCTAGTAGFLCQAEGTSPTAASAVDDLWADSSAHRLRMNNNNAGADTVGDVLMQACGSTSTCSATNLRGPQIVFGNAPLVSGTPSTVTITGFSPAFTSTGSFVCTVTDATNAANNLLKVVNASASSITITGPNSLSDTINYICVGN